MSTQRVTTNSRSAALVETPRDSPEIHWTPSGILERHFWKQRDVQMFNTEMLGFIVITPAIPVHIQVFIYLQVSGESDGHQQHQHGEGRTVRHSHLKVTGRRVKTNHWRWANEDVFMVLMGLILLQQPECDRMGERDGDSLFRNEHLDGEKSDEDHSYAAYWLV